MKQSALSILKLPTLIDCCLIIGTSLVGGGGGGEGWGVRMNVDHTHKSIFWYLKGIFLKFSDELCHHFYRGITLPPPPPSGGMAATTLT